MINFFFFLEPFLVPQSIQQQLPPSDVVGNIRFSHPTLYVFPGGQGDSALFGINGFNLLVDGGFSRKACFWDFSRHLDRLDAILITRISDDNAGGMSALLNRKTMSAVYPQIGKNRINLTRNVKSTVWKFRGFCIIQILREIKFYGFSKCEIHHFNTFRGSEF